MRRRDELTIHNERIKMVAAIFNAGGFAFFGLGFARPLVDSTVDITIFVAAYLIVSIAAWIAAYMILGQLKKDDEGAKEARK